VKKTRVREAVSMHKRTIAGIWKYLILFLFGGTAYYAMEVLFRGYSHPAMFVLGGLCFVLCGLINKWYTWEIPLFRQQFLCAGVITALEFVFGVVLNLYLRLDIWDYSALPFNLLGQICLPFTVLWFFLSLLAIGADDFLRWRYFGEEAPRYVLW
jgi:uncharacterized membrane protein